MNKITNIVFNNSTLLFHIVSDVAIVNTNEFAMVIDECTNINNMYCDDVTLHDYHLDYTNSEFVITEIVREGEEAEVTVQYLYEVAVTSELIAEMDNNMKYLKFFNTTERFANDYSDGIYYDPSVIYNNEIAMLKTYCSTCLDDKQMQAIMLLVFKRQLLESAIVTSHNQSAMQFYLDICKLLNVSLKDKTGKCNECKKCNNGMCSL